MPTNLCPGMFQPIKVNFVDSLIFGKSIIYTYQIFYVFLEIEPFRIG